MGKINFKNSKGLNLVGDFHEGKSNKCVILCHGFFSNKDREKAKRATESFNN